MARKKGYGNMGSIKWPKTVWVRRRAKDFCQYKCNEGAKYDLTGWVDQCFKSGEARDEVVRMLKKEVGIKYLLTTWIDYSKTTNAMQARVWNRVMKKLGYTEVV